ncbi:hypothetical protein FRX31_033764 [Thalictrum thalictroides]|uniref:Uncharacterized protein n=1 Tax=Thalictrum thalictroides TaxID=46969 RepID=A0A7J6UVS6_THATH|nr:hypothetical protein FRX31_033764 [Thalictrum thalictroides]
MEESFERFCKGITLFGPCWDQALDYWKLSIESKGITLFGPCWDQALDYWKLSIESLKKFYF